MKKDKGVYIGNKLNPKEMLQINVDFEEKKMEKNYHKIIIGKIGHGRCFDIRNVDRKTTKQKNE